MSHSWTVVHHRVALQPASLLVQRVEGAEALRGLMAVRSLGRHRRLVKLARIAGAARHRTHLIFHIGAGAHTSLEERQC